MFLRYQTVIFDGVRVEIVPLCPACGEIDWVPISKTKTRCRKCESSFGNDKAKIGLHYPELPTPQQKEDCETRLGKHVDLNGTWADVLACLRELCPYTSGTKKDEIRDVAGRTLREQAACLPEEGTKRRCP